MKTGASNNDGWKRSCNNELTIAMENNAILGHRPIVGILVQIQTRVIDGVRFPAGTSHNGLTVRKIGQESHAND